MLRIATWLYGIGCTNAVCERPLDKYCTDCPDLDEAIRRIEAGEVPYGFSSVALACANGDLVLVSTGQYHTRTEEYYSTRTGELVGAQVWDEGMAWCLREGVGEFGDLPRGCNLVCTIARHDECMPDLCDPLTVPMCDRSTGDTGR